MLLFTVSLFLLLLYILLKRPSFTITKMFSGGWYGNFITLLAPLSPHSLLYHPLYLLLRLGGMSYENDKLRINICIHCKNNFWRISSPFRWWRRRMYYCETSSMKHRQINSSYMYYIFRFEYSHGLLTFSIYLQTTASI